MVRCEEFKAITLGTKETFIITIFTLNIYKFKKT
jgi:hypothetical protein